MYKLMLICALFFFYANSKASVTDENLHLTQAATNFLKSLPDISNDSQIKITIPLSPKITNHCTDLKFSLLSKTNHSNNLQLNVLCDDPDSWHSIFNVIVVYPKKYYVAANDLNEGTIISESDMTVLHDFNAMISTAIIVKKENILGLTVTHAIQKGKFFLRSDLKPARALVIGQSIKIISRGNGFTISNQGKLLNNPTNGQLAHVETTTKKQVTGIVEGTTVVDILN